MYSLLNKCQSLLPYKLRFRIQPYLLLDYISCLLLLNSLRSWQSIPKDPSGTCEKVYLHSWSCFPHNLDYWQSNYSKCHDAPHSFAPVNFCYCYCQKHISPTSSRDILLLFLLHFNSIIWYTLTPWPGFKIFLHTYTKCFKMVMFTDNNPQHSSNIWSSDLLYAKWQYLNVSARCPLDVATYSLLCSVEPDK